jgi:hypothetical protein
MEGRKVDGLALIFFMGLGDYLMTTPVLAKLRQAYPCLPIHGYAADSADRVNSPLVIEQLRANPVFDKVATFRGAMAGTWPQYDIRDAIRQVPRNFLALPVIYDVGPEAFHRETAVAEAFRLPVTLPVSAPILPEGELSEQAEQILETLIQRSRAVSAKGIIFCHFGARSSGYVYGRATELVRLLVREGYFIAGLTSVGLTDEAVMEIDVAKISVRDTIEILRTLKQTAPPVYIVSVNSVTWPISAGLGIRNLGLHIFRDESVHQYLYPNIFIITPNAYPRVSPGRMFMSPPDTFVVQVDSRGLEFYDYDPAFVLACFLQFKEAV